MSGGVKVPWIAGQISWIGGQNRMGRGDNIPWIGGQNNMGGSRYTIGRGFNL